LPLWQEITPVRRNLVEGNNCFSPSEAGNAPTTSSLNRYYLSGTEDGH
jgi:hypothetical protein